MIEYDIPNSEHKLVITVEKDMVRRYHYTRGSDQPPTKMTTYKSELDRAIREYKEDSKSFERFHTTNGWYVNMIKFLSKHRSKPKNKRLT